MKKIHLLLLLLLLGQWTYGQEQDETVDQFFERVRGREILNRGFMGIEAYLTAQREDLFRKYELDIRNEADVATFDSLLHASIQMFERNAYVRLHGRYYYDYPPAEVERYLALADSLSHAELLLASNFKEEVDSLITYYQPYIMEEVHLIMAKIWAQYQPLVLSVIRDGQEVAVAEVDLDLLLHTNTDQPEVFSILDPATGQIVLPEDFDFATMTALTIRLDGKDYRVERYNRNLPPPLQETFSPLTPESFTDLPYWVLRIAEDKIGLETQTETVLERTKPIPPAEQRQRLLDSLRTMAAPALADALTLTQQVDTFTAFCVQLGEELIRRTGGYDQDHKPVGLANKEEVRQLFLEEKQAKVLKQKMLELRAAIWQLTDDQLGATEIETGYLPTKMTDQGWENFRFRNTPTAAVLPLLAIFRADARRDELTTLKYLVEKHE
jgi:hypothetical protein